MLATSDHQERVRALRIWLMLNEVTIAAVAERLKTPYSTVRKWLFLAKTIPTVNHKLLREVGFPPEHLPPAEDRKPGPKRKTPHFPIGSGK